jgi:hypothetical protein
MQDEYGNIETNPITAEVVAAREAIDHQAPVDLVDERLARITRLRLISDRGFPMWDLSYCYGVLTDGTPVRVRLPWHQFSKRNLKGDLIAMCRESGVYGKRLGLLDNEVLSLLT